MYKYLAITLSLVLLAGSVFGFFQYKGWEKERIKLRNQIAEAATMQKETETAYSRLALEARKLKSTNKELQKVIRDRNEKILALSNANLRLKDQIIKIKEAQEEVVDENGDSVEDPDDIPPEKRRHKVTFEKESDPLKVSGYTLTNPAYAEIELKWMRDLKLEVVLTKDKDGFFRIYLDSENSDIVPTELTLSVDPTILDRKWYEKVAFGTDIGLGIEGLFTTLKVTYDFKKVYLGPNILFIWNGEGYHKYFGVSLGWYAFRKIK